MSWCRSVRGMGVLVRPQVSRASVGLELTEREGNIGVYSLIYVPHPLVCGRLLKTTFEMLKRVSLTSIGYDRHKHD